MTTSKEKKTSTDEYRTMVVDVEPEANPTQDAPLPEPLATSMKHLDFSDLDAEREREQQAEASNSDEARLVAFFEGAEPWSDDLVALFMEATRGAEVNDDLFRRYLNQGHPKLIMLLAHAVDAHTSDRDLLYDLAYLVRGGPEQQSMISRYRKACRQETDPNRLRALISDWFELVIGEDSAAISKERLHFSNDPKKAAIFDLVAGQYNE